MKINKLFHELLTELLEEMTIIAVEKQVKIKYSSKTEMDHSFNSWLIKYKINDLIIYKDIVTYSNFNDYKSIEVTETSINQKNNIVHVLTNFNVKFNDNKTGEISL